MKVLIANRGEIAVRVIRTCKRMGIPTVAVYSTADADSLHVCMADEAICIGPPVTAESYLNIPRVIQACLTTGATHVHPGYGFLSENAEFARQLEQNGVTFIGPTPDSILSIGDKMRAKHLLRQNAPSVPLIPGYDGEDQRVETLTQRATEIGFPVLIKASAGGGGKGMRVVRETSKLREEIEMAKGEASRSFGDDKLLIEKYFEHVKHVEIQIIGDSHGNVYHCFERECSVQRRHQKVIEETPSPVMDHSLRRQMTDAALTIGRLIKYRNAGTVEFILDAKSRKFYFLEVNTRLQVEHPITEAITGLDLVELQLLVAQGKSLSGLGLDKLQINGHAIEARLYAEDPNNNFFPCTGTVQRWSHPPIASPTHPYPRYDMAITDGSTISVFYDPLIAKITVHAPTRQEAIDSMFQVLRRTICLGVVTNKSFLANVLSLQAFRGGQYTTRLVDELLQSTGIAFPLERFESITCRLHAASLANNQALSRLQRVPHYSSRYPPSPPQSPQAKEGSGGGASGSSRQASVEINAVQEALLVATFASAWWTREQKLAGTVYQSIPFGFRLARWSPSRHAFRISSPMPSKNEGKNDHRLVVEYMASSENLYGGTVAADEFLVRFVTEHVERVELQGGVVLKHAWRPKSVSQWLPVGQINVKFSPSSSSAAASGGRRRLAQVQIGLGDERYLKSYTIVQLLQNDGSVMDCFVHSDSWDRQLCLQKLDIRESLAGKSEDNQSAYTSTMPCRIVKLMVKDGQSVKKGEPLLTMESMKMETRLYSNHQGTVRLLVQEGQILEAGQRMVNISTDSDTTQIN